MLKKPKIKYFLAAALAAIAAIVSLTVGQVWMPAESQNQVQNQTEIKPAETSVKTISLKNAGLQLQEVGQGVYALISSTDFPPVSPAVAICNGGFVIGSDSVLVIDPFQTTELAELMLSTVK